MQYNFLPFHGFCDTFLKIFVFLLLLCKIKLYSQNFSIVKVKPTFITYFSYTLVYMSNIECITWIAGCGKYGVYIHENEMLCNYSIIFPVYGHPIYINIFLPLSVYFNRNVIFDFSLA